jgi:cysteine desulfurase
MSARAAIYLDANAGIPPLPEIRSGLGDILPLLCNPSSSHQAGRSAAALISRARESVTRSLGEILPGLKSGQWIFTSGGTEGLQGPIRAFFNSNPDGIWASQPTEHKGSLALVPAIGESHPGSCLSFPIDSSGRIDLEALPAFLAELPSGRPLLASVIWVNNETGVVQHRMRDLCRTLRDAGAWILVDAAQAWGKLRQEHALELFDFVAASGHKLGAFSGTGILASSDRAKQLLVRSPLLSGSQQSGLRAGTENTLGAWSLGLAASAAVWKHGNDLAEMRDQMEARICSRIAGAVITGRGADRVPNTSHISFDGIAARGLALTDRLDLAGFAVSAGSACSSGVRKASHVLKAMGFDEARALASIRISLPSDIHESQIYEFVTALEACVAAARTESSPRAGSSG